MAKYSRLTDRLLRDANAGVRQVTLRFGELDEITDGLPPTARTTRQWWANSSSTQALAWKAAGWHVETVDLTAGWVRFLPGERGGSGTGRAVGAAPLVEAPERPHAHRESWHWEGNVQQVLVTFLRHKGWDIDRTADTASQQQGVDIVATRDGELLLVEVKGFPGSTYARGPKAGEAKPTSPSLQAKHWLADAVMTALRLRNKRPEATVVIALPHFPRYRALLREIGGGLESAGVGWLFVHESGLVDMDEALGDQLRLE